MASTEANAMATFILLISLKEIDMSLYTKFIEYEYGKGETLSDSEALAFEIFHTLYHRPFIVSALEATEKELMEFESRKARMPDTEREDSVSSDILRGFIEVIEEKSTLGS